MREGRPADGTPRLRFRAAQRVSEAGVFQAALKEGARAGDDLIRVWVLRNGLERTRLGVVIGRRHGNAVQRNRLKRLIREAFRLERRELPEGLDVLCGPHVGVKLTFAGLRAALVRLVRLAERRLRN